jgi:hypothetical protein
MVGIDDSDLPEAAIVVGQWGQAGYFGHIRATWPNVRDIEERSVLIEVDGHRIWVSVVFGAPMVAMIAQ